MPLFHHFSPFLAIFYHLSPLKNAPFSPDHPEITSFRFISVILLVCTFQLICKIAPSSLLSRRFPPFLAIFRHLSPRHPRSLSAKSRDHPTPRPPTSAGFSPIRSPRPFRPVDLPSTSRRPLSDPLSTPSTPSLDPPSTPSSTFKRFNRRARVPARKPWVSSLFLEHRHNPKGYPFTKH